MSCALVGPDFTDRYFDRESSEDSDDVSSNGEINVDNDTGSDTDVEPDPEPDIDIAAVIRLTPVVGYVSAQATGMTTDEWMQRANEIFWKTAPARLRVAATPDILDRIYHFSMQAKDNRIIMSKVTGQTTKAGVNTSLLAINHDLYHQCRDTLYRDNVFVVNGYGSGLQYLGQNMGVDLCGHVCSKQPVIESLCIILGHDNHDQQGVLMCESFIQALKDIPNQITVDHLRIELTHCCFLGNKDFATFAFALKEKIKVGTDLVLCGFDYHWEWNLRLLPMGLGMRMQPLRCDFKYHNDREQKVGPFCCKYKLVETVNEKFGLDVDGQRLDIRDGKYYYELKQDGLYDGTGSGV